MPYCDDCAKYWTPSSLVDDGTCPTCGRPVDTGDRPATTADASAGDVDTGVPWHFKLMVVALVVYLGWRFVELGVELFN